MEYSASSLGRHSLHVLAGVSSQLLTCALRYSPWRTRADSIHTGVCRAAALPSPPVQPTAPGRAAGRGAVPATYRPHLSATEQNNSGLASLWKGGKVTHYFGTKWEKCSLFCCIIRHVRLKWADISMWTFRNERIYSQRLSLTEALVMSPRHAV